MRLSDVARGIGLDGLGELGLILFVGAFALIVWHTYSKSRKAELERMSRLPLED